MTGTRSKTEIFALGSAVTKEDGTITGCRLPNVKQILRATIFHLEDGKSENRTTYEAAKIVYLQVTMFYEKGGIPMMKEQSCCQKIVKLLKENENFRKTSKKKRASESVQEKVNNYEKELSKTFPLWSPNAEIIIKNQEDKDFLNSMKTDRKAAIAGLDIITLAKQKKSAERVLTAEKRQEKAVIDSQSQFSKIILDQNSSSEDEQPSTSFLPPPPPKSHKRTAKTGTEAFIPHNILSSPRLVSLASRMKMTPTQQAAFTQAIVDEIGSDPSKVSTSYAQAAKARHKVNEEIASDIKKSWIPPRFSSLHWDSKSLPTLTDQYKHDERLAVVVGDSEELKLLGIPSYKSGTKQKAGEIISKLTVDLLTEWKCNKNVVNMVFDTTAANTGHLTAACISIQQKLGRALFWSGCSHHYGEVIISHVFDDLKIETSRSPEVTVFAKLRKNWNDIPQDTQPLSYFEISNFPTETHDCILKWKAEIIYMSQLKSEFVRGDYKELMNLCVAYLNNGTEVKFCRPGAIHKARWMSQLVYALKIVLLEKQILMLPKEKKITMAQVAKIKDFVNFISLVYCSWWFKCDIAIDAPINTLQLYQNILKYKSINKIISDSAARSFKRHLWYLSSDLVPLSLFSSNVSNDEKRQMADKLVSLKPMEPVTVPRKRFGTGYGKPILPDSVSSNSKLSDFLNEDSWFFMSSLKINDEFLSLPVQDWELSEAYQEARCNVRAINITNDTAERGVKLSTDFLSSAKNENHYQDTLQVVEGDRKRAHNLRRKKTFEN
jgi:hypothetical protein